MNLDNILARIQNDKFGKYVPEKVETDLVVIASVVNEIGKNYEPNFKIETDFDKQLYKNLLLYFTDNPKCEWNLSKGLFFHGKKGTGKSLSIKIINRLYFYLQGNVIQRKKNFSMFAIESLKSNLDGFITLTQNNLFCDEVMRETKDDSKVIVNFGTREQPFSDGVHSMYRNFCNNGKLYHFTSNYWNVEGAENGKLISQIYGGEIHDRLLEMCNFIEFKSESKRL